MNVSAEFFAEAQELIDGYSQQLTAIEGQLRDEGEFDPDLLNGAFRALHTLKGLAGMFGHAPLLRTCHELESTLDRMRLGKLPLDLPSLDLMFESVELCERLLTLSDSDEAAHLVEPFLDRLAQLGAAPPPPPDNDLAWLDGELLAALTEFEEHRLRENIKLERQMLRVHVSFDLMEITTGIDALKLALKQHGEVISYMPSASASGEDKIGFEVLFGAKSSVAEVAASIEHDDVVLEVLATGQRLNLRSTGSAAPVPPVPAPAPVAPTPTPATPKLATPKPATPKPAEPDPSEASSSEPSAAPVDHGEHDQAGRQTVRVNLHKLDTLMNLVGELAVVRTNFDVAIQELGYIDTGNTYAREFRDQLRLMTRQLGQLQQGILEVRMVPIAGLCKKLAVGLRSDARELGKEVRFTVSGADTELDKLLIERLNQPFIHLLRNAIDHGIEAPERRAAAGKPRTGHIAFVAYQQGNRVVIELTDDGAGIDWRRVRDKAVERNVITPQEAQALGPEQALNLIFAAGFSTRDEASHISGRGFGMNIVKEQIAELSGMVDVATELGRGSRFRVTLPITLAIIQALVIDVSGQSFCIPLNSVIESIMVQRRDLQTIEGHEVVWVRGRTLPLVRLSNMFELGGNLRQRPARADDRLYVVVVGLAQHRIGLIVDELLGQQDVVIKSIGKALGHVPGIAGATELGNKRTVLVIDVASLVSESIGGLDRIGGLG